MRYHWGLGVGHVGMGAQVDHGNTPLAPASEDAGLLPEVTSPSNAADAPPTEEMDGLANGDDSDDESHQGNERPEENPINDKDHHHMFGDNDEPAGSYD